MNDFLKKLETTTSGRGKGNPLSGKKNLDRISTALWVFQEGKDLFDKARDAHTRKTTWTVTVEESDSIYRRAQEWLLSVAPRMEHKNVTATSQTYYVDSSGNELNGNGSSWADPFSDYTPNSGVAKTRVNLSLQAGYSQVVEVDGHKVRAHLANSDSDRELESPGVRPIRRGGKGVSNGRIVFTCRSLEAQHAVVNLLESMVSKETQRVPSLWVADSWGQWRAADAPPRKLSSVVLGEGVKDDVMSDLRKFLKDEKKYSELGIPWHRGYLFHGPAGTGKTSLIKAIASELGLDLWYAPLGDMKEDSSLVDLVRSVKARGILLLEDVDSYSAARDRGEEGGDGGAVKPGEGVSTSAILNALDGVVTPHGLITIMTTNHLDKLDPALVRSGRADRVIELGLPEWSEVREMWAMFFPKESVLTEEEPEGFAEAGMSQATISEIFKRYWDEPEIAVKTLMEEVSS